MAPIDGSGGGRWKTAIEGGGGEGGSEREPGNEGERWATVGAFTLQKTKPPVDSVSNEEEKQKCWRDKGEKLAQGLKRERKKKKGGVKEEIYLL